MAQHLPGPQEAEQQLVLDEEPTERAYRLPYERVPHDEIRIDLSPERFTGSLRSRDSLRRAGEFVVVFAVAGGMATLSVMLCRLCAADGRLVLGVTVLAAFATVTVGLLWLRRRR